MLITNDLLPSIGFLRLPQIIGHPKSGTPPLVPVSRAVWLNGVRDGRYPKPVRIASKAVAWRVEDIRRFIADPSAPWSAPEDQKDKNLDSQK